jgi:ActR/RegA family two-component response regulator
METPAILERREHIRRLHSAGYNAKTIAQKIGVHRNTIHRDLSEMDVPLFSVVSDADLDGSWQGNS